MNFVLKSTTVRRFAGFCFGSVRRFTTALTKCLEWHSILSQRNQQTIIFNFTSFMRWSNKLLVSLHKNTNNCKKINPSKKAIHDLSLQFIWTKILNNLKTNACSVVSPGPTINRAVLKALRVGRFLWSSPARQDYFFVNEKSKKKKREISIFK